MHLLISMALIVVFALVIRHDYALVKGTLWSDLTKIGKKVDPEAVTMKATSTSLDTYRPDSFGPLMEAARNPDAPLKQLDETINYYEKIIRYRPYQMEAYVLLGYCYYYAGRMEEAILVFKRAIALEPSFFWSYYNLGAIYYNAQEQAVAAEFFKRALETDPRQTLAIIAHSRIYVEILSREKEMQDNLGTSLLGHYQKAQEALTQSIRRPLPVRFF